MDSLQEIFVPTPDAVERFKVGLCLSGGSALGFAHIGVLQALEDYRIYPEAISGSGIGAFIGAIYAAGYTPAQIFQFAKEDKWRKLAAQMSFKPSFWNSGYSSHNVFFELMQEFVPNNSFYKLEKKLFVCVSNLTLGTWETVSEGEMLNHWVAASCSIPGLFNAVKMGGYTYTYGGLLNNMPAQPLTEVCDVVIGSDVLPFRPTSKMLTAKNLVVTSLRAIQHHNSLQGRTLCSYLIESDVASRYSEFDFEAYQAIYQAGYKSAQHYIIANRSLLDYQKKKRERSTATKQK